jgi:hypothetical protein
MPSTARPGRFIDRTILAGVLAGLLLAGTSMAPLNAAGPVTRDRVAAHTRAGGTGGVSAAEPASQQDPAFLALKDAGRIGRRADGSFGVLAPLPVSLAPGLTTSGSLPFNLGHARKLTNAPSARLPIDWTGRVWEPKGSGGVDDRGHAYTDPNYWNFCAPGAAVVAMYYFANSYPLATGIGARTYTEPRNNGHQATTYWTATDRSSKGRGALMWMAEYVKPPVGYAWPLRGMVNWSTPYPPSTPVNRLRDALNWEASGRTRVDYFYVQAKASTLTRAMLQIDIRSDVGVARVPVIATVRTGNGTVSLPAWRKTAGVNHSIAIVGYDNIASTYTFVDTCGPGCNNTGRAAGVYTVSQATMWALLRAETDNDGILW